MEKRIVGVVLMLILCGVLIVNAVAAVMDHAVYLPYMAKNDAPTPTPVATPDPDNPWNGHDNPTPAFNSANMKSNARWVYCAQEGEVCDIDDGYLIAYGDRAKIGNNTLGVFSYTWVEPGANGVTCNDSTFVNPFVEQAYEPYDVTKACWLYAPDDVSIEPPTDDPNWMFCGIEKENCEFGATPTETMEVAYGTADDHRILGNYSTVTLIELAERLRDEGALDNGATCQNEMFQVDASKGICWVRPIP